MILLYILAACGLLGLISFLGVITFSLNKKLLLRVSTLLVALSAGVLMGDAFMHLLPEANEVLSSSQVFSGVLVAYVLFFSLESVLQWHHCHIEDGEHKHNHPVGYMNLVGDGVHNFIDGLIIAATFMVDVNLGWATTLAVALHEIPQEFSDFGVLIHSGFSKNQALFLNFLVAMMAILGALLGYVLAGEVEGLVNWLLPFAAGGFIYIATSDLVPQIKRERSFWKAVANMAVFISGLAIMYGMTFIA